MVKLTPVVSRGLERVRKDGKYNMFDRANVVKELIRNGSFEAANWVSDNPRMYGRLIMTGPLIADESDTDE